MSKNLNKNVGIMIIRVLAMFSIIICHIFQQDGNELAYWFNVGVQIFLFTSGFLFGGKEITNVKDWLLKRCRKILIPYYIYIVLAIIYYLCVKPEYVDLQNIGVTFFLLQLFLSGIKGLGHLWFIPLILICYLVTPILQKLYTKIMEKENILSGIIKLVLGLIVLQVSIIIPFISNTLISNLICYILGYFISKLYNDKKIDNKILKWITMVITISAIIMSIIYIMINYTNILQIEKNAIINIMLSYKNVFNGIAIFLILYLNLKDITEIKNEKARKVLETIDKYSFEVYITHLIYILGPSTILNTMGNRVIELLIITVLIAVSAWILKRLTDIITNLKLKENKI